MGLNKVTKFVFNAQNRLIEQDKRRVRLPALVDAFVSEIQEVENAMFDIYKNCGVYTATGAQLDIVGSMVGESRVGRSDDIYRTAILARIQLNIGAGEPNTIINAIKQWMNPSIIDFSEPYPAYFTLFIQSSVNIPNIASIVKEISPVGVDSSVSTLPTGLIPFRLGTAKGTAADFSVNSMPNSLDNYAISNIDTLQIEAISIYSLSSNGGLGTAYPTRYTYDVDSAGTEYDTGDGSTLELKLINVPEEHTISLFGGRLATVKI